MGLPAPHCFVPDATWLLARTRAELGVHTGRKPPRALDVQQGALAHWTSSQPLEATLSTHYALSDAPLTPVMFDSSDPKPATVFACATTGKIYRYYGPSFLYRRRKTVDAFEGKFPSVEAFIEQADWNRVERIKRATWANNKPLSSKQPILT
jgi:hypothetical protein